jgi:DNA-binding MarR family transcriptional regulator
MYQDNTAMMAAIPLGQATAVSGMGEYGPRTLGPPPWGGGGDLGAARRAAAPRLRRTGGARVTAPASGGAVRGVGARADGLAEGIARLRRALRRGARVANPANPLAVAQLEVLSVLAEHPGARPGQLARLLHMRPNTVTTIVNALTARGMIGRATADGDRRAVELTVTDAGQEAVRAWQATNAAVLHLALSTLPGSQRRALAAAVPAIDALAKAIDRLADTPAR